MNIQTNLIGALVKHLVRTEDKTALTPSRAVYEVVVISHDNKGSLIAHLAECDAFGKRIPGKVLISDFLWTLVIH